MSIQPKTLPAPQSVRDEFDTFLDAASWSTVSCACAVAIAATTSVAFNCKRRGFCTTSSARRMAQTAAHLVNHVIPHVPARQWVLSLAIPLRLLLATQP